MSANEMNTEDLTPKKEPDCKDVSDEKTSDEVMSAEGLSAEDLEEARKKEKRDEAIISTVIDGVLSFFQVW